MAIPARSRRQQIAFWLALVAFVAVATWVVFQRVSPAPPRTLTLSTGGTDGAYHAFGKRYQEILRQQGVTLVLQPSSGSLENLQRLNDGRTSVAFVQGGLGTLALDPLADADTDTTPLRSLATVALEPVWIFSHALTLQPGLTALKGRRVAVGVAGSGNQKLALDLLRIYGVVDAAGQPLGGTQLVETGGSAAASQLIGGEVDAALFVAAPQAAAVAQLLKAPGVQLASLEHAEGLTRRYPYLRLVSLRRGSVDPPLDRPARDITLLATSANLVMHEDVHPALAYLLLEAARAVHRQPGLLNRTDDFPSATGTDFPLAEEAARYFKNGRPFLQRYLPFWVANFVQRLILLLVPLVAVLVPLFRILPPLLQWRQSSRLFRHYGELKFLEADMATRTLDAAERDRARTQLDRIAQDVMSTQFPLDFSDRVYTLRQHVDYVRAQLSRQADRPEEPPRPHG